MAKAHIFGGGNKRKLSSVMAMKRNGRNLGCQSAQWRRSGINGGNVTALSIRNESQLNISGVQ